MAKKPLSTALAIVREAGKLNTLISEVITLGVKYRDKLHLAAVSSTYMAVVDGQPDPLNRLFASLTSNDQTAFRQYIRKAHIAIGAHFGKVELDGTQSPEELTALASIGTVLRFAEKKFNVTRNDEAKGDWQPKRNKEHFAKMLEGPMLSTTDEWPRFFSVNNFASIRTIGDAEVIDTIQRLRKQVTEGGSERVKIDVSDKVKRRLIEFADGFAATKEQQKNVDGGAPAASNRRRPSAETHAAS